MADPLPQTAGATDPFDDLFQQELQKAWGQNWNRYNRAVQSGNIDLSTSIHDEVRDTAARKASIALRRTEAKQEIRAEDFMGMVATNPRGWGNQPPPSGFTGSARSANTPMGDAVAQATGSPLAGSMATGAENISRGVVDTAYGLTGIPMAQSGGENLARAVEEGSLGKGALAAGEIGLAAVPGPMIRGGKRIVEGVGEIAARAPKTAAGVTGSVGGGLALSPSEAAPGGSDEVRRLQEKLRDSGYYTGPIDGLMKGKTQDAKQRFEADETARRAQEVERAKAEAAAAKAGAETKETERRTKEAEETSERRRQGEERLRKVEEDVPWYRKAFRDYAPMAGYVAGAALGVGSRKYVKGASDRASKEAADRADELLAGKKGDWNSRAANVNQFWAEGQSVPFRGERQVPFSADPGKTPSFRSNPDAPSSADLYTPNRAKNVLTDAAVMGAYGAEAVGSHFLAVEPMRAELRAAEEAMKNDQSEASIARYQAAKDKVAGAEFLSNVGRAAAPMYGLSGAEIRRSPSRPNIAGAEAERGRIDNYLASKAAPAEASYLAPAHAKEPKPVKGHTWHKNPTGWTLKDDATGAFVSPKNYLEAAKKKP